MRACVWVIEREGCGGREIPSETGFMSSMASPTRRRRKRLAPKDLLRRSPLSAQRRQPPRPTASKSPYAARPFRRPSVSLSYARP